MSLLSRTADNLYWLGRYMERAENTTRLLEVTHRISQLPGTDLEPNAEWVAALDVVGQKAVYHKRFKRLTQAKATGFLTVDNKNLASIKNTIHAARENARAERNSIPTEVFESLNATWLTLKDIKSNSLTTDGYQDFFDWVKERVHALRGLIYGVMLRTEAFQFHRIGTYIERGDNTARLVDVNYRLLSAPRAGEEIDDYYRWVALLRSLSAFKAYRRVYRGQVRPMQVVELLLLNPDLPRSINFCTGTVAQTLEDLGPDTRGAFLAKRLHQQFSKASIDKVVGSNSLHTVLDQFSDNSSALSDQIAKDFLLHA